MDRIIARGETALIPLDASDVARETETKMRATLARRFKRLEQLSSREHPPDGPGTESNLAHSKDAAEDRSTQV